MRLGTTALICLLFAPLGFADQIVLNNGDRITGKVVKKEDGSLTIKSDLMGDVTVNWKDVASLTIDQPVTVALPPDKNVQGTVATEGDKIVVKTPTTTEEAPLQSVTAVRNAAEQHRYERYLKPPLTDLWAGYADFSIASAQGNARTLTTALAVNAARVTKTDKISMYFNQIYSRGLLDNVVVATASAIRGGWAYNRSASKRLFWNTFNDFEHDRFQSLDMRVVLGSGLGVSLYKSDRGQVDLIGGGSWNRESYSNPLEPATDTTDAIFVRNSGEAYWGNDLQWKLTKLSALKQSFRMFDNLSNTGEYRANLDLGIDTKLWKMLSWQVTASDRYITNPAPGRKTNDLLVSSGIRFTFSRMP